MRHKHSIREGDGMRRLIGDLEMILGMLLLFGVLLLATYFVGFFIYGSVHVAFG
jgi:hypothetical protein